MLSSFLGISYVLMVIHQIEFDGIGKMYSQKIEAECAHHRKPEIIAQYYTAQHAIINAFAERIVANNKNTVDVPIVNNICDIYKDAEHTFCVAEYNGLTSQLETLFSKYLEMIRAPRPRTQYEIDRARQDSRDRRHDSRGRNYK